MAWQSDRLQLWFNNTNTEWHDDSLHAHRESDEIFVVLEGTVVVEVDATLFRLGPVSSAPFPTDSRPPSSKPNRRFAR